MKKNKLIRDIESFRPKKGECAFWWLGQHSFIVKFRDTICLLDPFLTPMKDRLVAPPFRPEDFTDAALVLGSHDHGDHIDRDAWPALAEASPEAVFVVPKLLRERVIREVGLPSNRVLGADHHLAIEKDGVKVTGVPAAHEFLDVDKKSGLHPCLGFVVESSGFTLYHAGDTCLYEGMRAILRKWEFDLAFLPINGRDARRLAAGCIGNMTYQEAADLAGDLRPGLTVPAHFDMFKMNRENPQLFIDYMKVKYPALKAQVPLYFKRTVVKKKSR
jgi:L-ascorbate 6-phosphate lactonase